MDKCQNYELCHNSLLSTEKEFCSICIKPYKLGYEDGLKDARNDN